MLPALPDCANVPESILPFSGQEEQGFLQSQPHGLSTHFSKAEATVLVHSLGEQPWWLSSTEIQRFLLGGYKQGQADQIHGAAAASQWDSRQIPCSIKAHSPATAKLRWGTTRMAQPFEPFPPTKQKNTGSPFLIKLVANTSILRIAELPGISRGVEMSTKARRPVMDPKNTDRAFSSPAEAGAARSWRLRSLLEDAERGNAAQQSSGMQQASAMLLS